MKPCTRREAEGKTIRGIAIPDGMFEENAVIVFTDDTYLRVDVNQGYDGANGSLLFGGDLNKPTHLYGFRDELIRVGFITEEEYDKQAKYEQEQNYYQNLAHERRQYEELKKKFEPI